MKQGHEGHRVFSMTTHTRGGWEDDQPHPVTREPSQLKIIVTTNEAKGQAIGHNEWWIPPSGALQQGRGDGTTERGQNLRVE